MSSKDWLVPFQPTLTTLERPASLRTTSCAPSKRPVQTPRGSHATQVTAVFSIRTNRVFSLWRTLQKMVRTLEILMISYDFIWFWLAVTYPSWKIWKSMGRIIPYIMENKSHVPNHRPGLEYDFLNRTCWFLSCNTKTCCGQSVHSRTNLGISGHLAGTPDIIPYLKWSSTVQSCCFASSVQD
jgi:hypothetical protein